MVIIEAKIKLKNSYNSVQDFLNSCLKLVIKFDHKGHESIVESKKGNSIFFEKEEEVVITIPTGECSLDYIKNGKMFELYYGKKVGYGIVTYIKEIYVEYKNLRLLDSEERCMEIIRIAENIDNALIYEEVYSLLN